MKFVFPRAEKQPMTDAWESTLGAFRLELYNVHAPTYYLYLWIDLDPDNEFEANWDVVDGHPSEVRMTASEDEIQDYFQRAWTALHRGLERAKSAA
ncbi:hypothetical protein Rctr85_071 [Virus Rctr85]|nr:hypothetical protein Rctr85_071 [Virus Rctr85]